MEGALAQEQLEVKSSKKDVIMSEMIIILTKGESSVRRANRIGRVKGWEQSLVKTEEQVELKEKRKKKSQRSRESM